MNTTQTNIRGTLAPLLSIAVIIALFSLAQTFAASSDDFNDNIKNPSMWGTDQQILFGRLTETNQRLEFTSARGLHIYAARPWILTQFPSNADWEIQIDTFNITSPGPIFLQSSDFGIEIHGPDNSSDRVTAYLSSPWFDLGFVSHLSSAAGIDGDGSAYSGHSATNGAMRIAFDGATKVITVLYDQDVTNGYQWVAYGSFGIAGAGGANGNTNWGLAEGDQFSAFVYGRATLENRQVIASGQMFGDKFMETGGVPPKPASVGNISTRGRVETGDNVMIGGFIVEGTQPKKVIVRAMGPTLTQYGVPGVLADPTLNLHNSTGQLITSNNNWKNTQQAEIQASGKAPGSDLESAILTTLDPGAYTAIVRGMNSTTGIALVEAYDLDRTVDSKFANVSTRGYVQTGDNVIIGGLIIQENSPAKVIVRAIGPSLTQAGIANPLQDPTLELHDGNGALIISNDDWKDSQQAEIQATGLVPSNNAESAIIATLSPGPYTAVVRGKNGTSGVALVETYQLGN